MITGDAIFDLPYYNAGGIFTGGSIHGRRYRIEKADGPVFLATVWTGGNCYDKTPEELMTRNTFSFDAAGREDLLAWLNTMMEE